MSEAAPKLRIDKWLWFARFFKTRSLAARMVSAGLRVNAERTDRPGATLRIGDVLTFSQGQRVRIIRVTALGERRGPAAEAATLYEDLTPAAEPPAPRAGPRPTKKDRRALDHMRPSDT